MTASYKGEQDMRKWCTYLEYSERGTVLGYGWAIARSNSNMRGTLGKLEHYLIEPEGNGQPFWKPATSVDLEPLRREGESHEEWMARR